MDGVFGNNTKNAVEDYQRKNGLQVDGIAGNETWGSLTAAPVQQTQTAQQMQQTNQQTTTAPDYSKWKYDSAADEAYQEALKKLQDAQGQMPEYSASYDQQMNELFQKIMNREKFSYDVNSDPAYQQYREQFMQTGQQAMQDTVGQAAGLTGGYGSSYAQNAGQQAYQAYLQKLNEVVPELQQQARERHNQEGEMLYDQYAIMGDLADTEYGRYQDALNQYWQNISLQKELADDAYEQGYNNWWNAVQMQQNEDELAYQKYRDQVADEQWQKEFDEARRQYDQEYAFAQQQYNDAKNASYYGGDSKDVPYNADGYSVEEIKDLQRRAGIEQDGIWGPDTQKAYEAGFRPDIRTANMLTSSQALNAAIETAGSSKEGQIRALYAMYEKGEITEAQLNDLAFAITNPGK